MIISFTHSGFLRMAKMVIGRRLFRTLVQTAGQSASLYTKDALISQLRFSYLRNDRLGARGRIIYSSPCLVLLCNCNWN